jgi:hypothetical protein
MQQAQVFRLKATAAVDAAWTLHQRVVAQRENSNRR